MPEFNLEEALPAAKQLAQQTLGSMRGFFQKSEAGRELINIHTNQYVPAFHKALDAGVAQAKELHAQGVPIEMSQIVSQASNTARRASLGHNDAIAAYLTKAAQMEHGDFHAATFQNHLAMLYHDHVERTFAQDMKDIKNRTGSKAKVSSIKQNISNNPIFKGKPVGDINAVYSPPSALERAATSWTSTVAAPFIAIPHANNFMNMTLETPLTSFAKGMAEVIPGTASYERQAEFVRQTGALADTTFSAFKEAMEYKNGRIAKLTGSPTVGYIVNKMIHAPGFNSIRTWTVVAAGSVGKHVAEDSAMKIMRNPNDQRAAMLLTRMGIDPAVVRAQKGNLNMDQLEKATFKFIDDNVFLDRKLSQSYFAQSSPIFRAGTLFHSYVNQQGHFMKRSFMSAIKSGNPMQIAQFFAVAGVAFPFVGEATNQVERFARGQGSDFEERKKEFDKKQGVMKLVDASEEYIESLSHMGGVGIGLSYLHAAGQHKLAQAMLGAEIGTGVEMLQDMVDIGKYPERSGPKTALARDLLRQTPDHIGMYAAHKLLPTQKEERANSNKPQRLKSLRMKGFKKLN